MEGPETTGIGGLLGLLLTFVGRLIDWTTSILPPAFMVYVSEWDLRGAVMQFDYYLGQLNYLVPVRPAFDVIISAYAIALGLRVIRYLLSLIPGVTV